MTLPGQVASPPNLLYASAPGRWVLFTTVLGSALAFVDLTAVNLALPAIGRDLGAGASGLNWTVNAYALTLSALMLLGGSLGDLLGRRRVYELGIAWFALASLACAIAPSIEVLIGARALQGVGAALLTPEASPSSRRASARRTGALPSERGRGSEGSRAQPARSSAAT